MDSGGNLSARRAKKPGDPPIRRPTPHSKKPVNPADSETANTGSKPLSSSTWSWPRHLIRCAVLMLIVYLVYSNSFQSGFVLDNQFIIKLDPRIKSASLENLKLIWGKDYWWPKTETGAYRPVVTTSYLVNWSVLGSGTEARESEQVVGFHWVNLVTHGINAILAYLLMLKLLRRPWAAFFTAALFAVHPIATEAVTNIIGRADEFEVTAFVGCTLLYIRSTESRGFRRLPWLVGLMVLFAAGCFSKESTIAFLAIPILYDGIYRWGSATYRGRLARSILRDAIWYIPVALPFIALLLSRRVVFPNAVPPRLFLDNPITRFEWNAANSFSVNAQNWILKFMTACNVATKALWKLVWPATLSTEYSYNQIKLFGWQLSNLEDIKAILSMLFIAGTLVLALWFWKRNKTVSFFIFFYWIAYGPTSNFLVTSSSIIAERFLYLPLLAFSALTVLGVERLLRQFGSTLEFDAGSIKHPWPRLAPHAVIVVILILYGSRSYARNYDWRSDITLGEAAMEASPRSFRSYAKLAEAYYQADPYGELDHAIELAQKGVAIIDPLPNSENGSPTYMTLGIYYGLKGELAATRSNGLLLMNERTRTWYEKSARVLERGSEIELVNSQANRARELQRGNADFPDTEPAELYQYLGMSYERMGMNEKALEAFKFMRYLNPGAAEPYAHIGTIQFQMGNAEDAATSLTQCVILDPQRQDAWQLLIQIYSQINHEPIPAVEEAGGIPQVREDNKMVQQHLRDAYAGFIRIARASQNANLLNDARNEALNHYHFDSKVIDDALHENIARPLPPRPVFHTFGKKLADEP
jgi:tetratricopeptide (TPR) repeat protein